MQSNPSVPAAADPENQNPGSADAPVREISRGELRSPACVLDIDVQRDYADDVLDLEGIQTAWCLVRRDGVAVAARFLDVAAVDRIEFNALARQLAVSGLPKTPDAPAPSADSLTVVICTRDRIDGLRVTLASLARQSDSEFEVLVVDNSARGETAQALTEFDGLRIRCCHEPTPGLSHARNRGLADIQTDLVAWIDDDEVADPDWIRWVKRGFAAACQPQAVAGFMLPAELQTEAQINFERYGGFNKGRGMEPEILRAGTPSVVDPFYPLPNFGAGGNISFRTDALRRIGGFDSRLGAGTLTHGGEETLALSLILDSGASVLHWPPALTWHYHRRTDAELEKQFYGYSAGLTAYYMSLVLSSPRYLARIAGFVPAGVRRILAQRGQANSDAPPPDFPEVLLRASRRGLRDGAWNYLKEVRRQRRARSGR